MTDLGDWITHTSLREAARDTVFGRGKAYFRHGAVSRLNDTGRRLTARVRGTETYEVELWTEGHELEYDCTCPHAAEGFFCKHKECATLRSWRFGLPWPNRPLRGRFLPSAAPAVPVTRSSTPRSPTKALG